VFNCCVRLDTDQLAQRDEVTFICDQKTLCCTA